MKPPSGGWREVALLVAVALASRAVTLGNPITHVDEQFYLVAARAMHGGAWLYSDVWDRKPVGLFLLYRPAAALPMPVAVWAYQLFAAACAVATAALVARLARAAGWDAGARIAGIAYLLWIVLVEGHGGQSPVFYNPLVAGAALLLAGDDGRRAWRPVAAMLLVGLAMQVKYTAVFEGVFFGLWATWRHRRARGTPAAIGLAAMMAAVALAPTAAAAGVYAAAGRLPDFVYANFTSILARRPDPWGERLGNLAGLVAILSPLVAMAGITLAMERGRPDTRRLFLFGWLAAALAGILVFGSWFDHYALPAMVPAAACAAGALGGHPRVRRWAVPILLVVAIGGQVLLVAKRRGRGSPAEFAALADAVGRGPGCLWVQSGETMLYPWTGRCAVTRYLFPSHLGRAREAGAIGVDQAAEVRRILAARPAVIVMRPAYRGERSAIRAIATAAVARDYALAAALPLGSNVVRVYRRRSITPR